MTGKPDLSVGDYFEMRRELIFADRPADIAWLENLIGETQAEVVDDIVVNSCWWQELPDFVGGKGTPAERRNSLRAVFAGKRAPFPTFAGGFRSSEIEEASLRLNTAVKILSGFAGKQFHVNRRPAWAAGLQFLASANTSGGTPAGLISFTDRREETAA